MFPKTECCRASRDHEQVPAVLPNASTQHALCRRTNTGIPQPRPDLPVSLSEEGTGLNHGPDLFGHLYPHRPSMARAYQPQQKRGARGATPDSKSSPEAPSPRGTTPYRTCLSRKSSGAAHGFSASTSTARRFCSRSNVIQAPDPAGSFVVFLCQMHRLRGFSILYPASARSRQYARCWCVRIRLLKH